MCDVHVILVNWNSAQDTIECLESLLNQEGVSLECIVVDNCSEDDSVNQIRARFPQVHLIENEKNLGFQAGNNIGICYALEQNARNIFILNNDTIAEPDMVRKLLQHLSPEFSVVTPAIFYAGQRDQIWSLGGMINPLILEMPSSLIRKPLTLPDAPVERDFVTGCATFVRADVLKDVGLFDEAFFPIYYEDLDLCLRIRRKGYRMLLVPQAHLYHKVSQASGGQTSPRVYFLMGRNSGIYFRKHMRFWNVPFVLVYRLISALKTSWQLAIRKKWTNLAALWNGLACGWTGLSLKSSERYLAHYKK